MLRQWDRLPLLVPLPFTSPLQPLVKRGQRLFCALLPSSFENHTHP